MLTDRTENYEIRGKPGLWSVVDTMVVEQSVFFLMENAKYGRDVPSVVLDAVGTIVIEDCRNDFDDNAVQQIRKFLHSHGSGQIHVKPEPELYQRYFENGEYVRTASPEVREEANYNMIDGLHNNVDPKKRPSVRKRLKEKLALVHGSAPAPQERMKG